MLFAFAALISEERKGVLALLNQCDCNQNAFQNEVARLKKEHAKNAESLTQLPAAKDAEAKVPTHRCMHACACAHSDAPV